jgi:SAM-dependent methyltransferase
VTNTPESHVTDTPDHDATDTPVSLSTAPAPAALAPYAQAPDPGPLLALNFGFARARALGTAVDLGVFTVLDRGPLTAERLAAELGCDARALGDLLAVLAEFALLSGDDEVGWTTTELSRAYLVEGAPTYLGEHFTDVIAQWDRWGALTSVVRSGGRGGDLGGPEARGRHRGMFGENFPLAVRSAFDAVGALGLRPAGRVLDFTCGGGEWGIALATTDPEARVTAHDDPALLTAVRARAAEFGVARRFRYEPADFTRAPFPDGAFDTVVMAHAGRFAGPDTAAALVRECARVLRPGGTLLLADVMREQPGQPAGNRPMLALSLLVNTPNGAVLAVEDYRRLMQDAGVTAKESVTRGLLTALTGERQ